MRWLNSVRWLCVNTFTRDLSYAANRQVLVGRKLDMPVQKVVLLNRKQPWHGWDGIEQTRTRFCAQREPTACAISPLRPVHFFNS